MSKLRIVAAAVALLLAGALTGALLPAHSQRPTGDNFKVYQLDREEQTQTIDVNGDGNDESVGDLDVGHGPVRRGGKRVGNQKHECTVVHAAQTRFALHCTGTFTIKGRGKIEIAGLLAFTRRGIASRTLSIVGGTREFRDASGVMLFDGRRGRTIFEFRVVQN